MPLRHIATTNQSVRSGQTPPKSPNPYEGKYHESAVEMVRNPTSVTKSASLRRWRISARSSGLATLKSTGKTSSAVKLSW